MTSHLLAMHAIDESDFSDEDASFLLDFLTKEPRRYDRNFEIDDLSNEECFLNFRFEKDDIVRLKTGLRVPDIVKTEAGKIPGIEALAILLKRMAYPGRLKDHGKVFQRSGSSISRIFRDLMDEIYDAHNFRLLSLQHPWINMNEMAAAITAKGSPLHNCVGFLDGTVRAICRPTKHQRMVFNGHKRLHSLKFQSMIFPNGLIGHLYGPMCGRRHDCALLRESGLMPLFNARAPNFTLYGDKGYPIQRNLIAPYTGNHLTPQQEHFNREMSKIRTSVEWGFGKIIRDFAFLDFKKNQKILLQPVGKQYLLGGLLTNCHTCLYGSLCSDYFRCNPPTLEAYLY